MPVRRYPFDFIVNCRDLGGYPCVNGGVTAFGRMLRCGIPRNPSPADLEKLEKFGIKTVIDLRGDKEAVERPSVFKELSGLDYHQISLLEVNPAIVKAQLTLKDIYINSVEYYKENYAGVFRALAGARVPILYHCFLGKDRTGILTALILSLAGASREDIIADYQVSGTYLIPFYKREIEAETGLIWESSKERLYSEPANMAYLLDYFESEYGGAEGYLLSAGVSRGDIEKASRLLL